MEAGDGSLPAFRILAAREDDLRTLARELQRGGSRSAIGASDEDPLAGKRRDIGCFP